MKTHLEEIREIFSIFHDGTIVAHRISAETLDLEIEILYLTQRIDKAYTKFFLSLQNVHDFSFSTWPKDVNAAPTLIRDPAQIFAGELTILSSDIKNGSVEIAMDQPSDGFDYCGGTLSFKANTASVLDEGGKQYTVNELGQICEEYWAEWSRKSKT
ncbi:MAG TPA: hypothetical protein VGM36_05655 [Rhizomicrobium sp.]|jgi:hypothetical protein